MITREEATKLKHMTSTAILFESTCTRMAYDGVSTNRDHSEAQSRCIDAQSRLYKYIESLVKVD